MPKESTIQHYTSATTGNTPTTGNLASGELAINTADEKIFYKNHIGTVLSLSQTKDLSGAFASISKVVSSVNGATGAITNVAVTNATNNFTAVQAFPNGVSGDWIKTGAGATFGANVALSSSTAQISGYNTAGYLKLESFGTPFSAQAEPTIIFQDGDTDLGGNGTITIDPSSGSGGGTVNIGNASSPIINLQGNTVNSGRMAVVGGLTANNFLVTAGSTFNGRASFAAGLTAQGLYVSQGATFNSTAAFSGNVSAPNIVNSFNGATGTVLYSPAIATSSVTGVASFNSTYFSVSTGAVSLASAYQATGDTVSASTGISVSRSGNTSTISNTGVQSLNGLTGAVTLTAGSNITLTPAGNTITIASTASGGGGITTSARNAWTVAQAFEAGLTFSGTLTGTSSSQLNVPTVYTNTILPYSAASVIIGDAVTVAVLGDGLYNGNATLVYVDDNTQTLNLNCPNGVVKIGDADENGGPQVSVNSPAANIVLNPSTGPVLPGLQPYVTVNSSYLDFGTLTLTGNVGLFRGGITASARSQFVGGLTAANLFVSNGATFNSNISAPNIVNSFNGAVGAISYAPPLATASVTGVASFNSTYFSVSTGAVSLASAYQATGDTVAAGTGISVSRSGNTSTVSGFSRSINTITTSTNAGSTASTDYVYIGATSGNINLTLPTAVSNTNRYTVKQTDIGTLTILTTSSQTIDGVTGFNLNKQYQAIDLISNNSNWIIV